MGKQRYMKGWRAEVIEIYGPTCVAGPGCEGRLEAHHLLYRSQGGADDPWNGIPLCTLHHKAVHARQLLVERDWLHASTIAYLADEQAVEWDDEGRPFGRHWKGYAVVASR